MNLGNIIRKTMGIAHHQSASDRACLSQLFSICLICGLEDSPNQPSYSKDKDYDIETNQEIWDSFDISFCSCGFL